MLHRLTRPEAAWLAARIHFWSVVTGFPAGKEKKMALVMRL